jgi:hypothetical protein
MVILIKDIAKDDDGDFEKIGVVKKYFSRVYTVLKPDIRDRLENLNIPEKKKKKLKRELAFLSEEKQYEYLDELCNDSEEIEEY